MKNYISQNTEYVNDQFFMVLIAIVIGILGGFGAVLFRWMIDFFQSLFFLTENYTLDWVRSLPFWHKILAPVMGALIVSPIALWFAGEIRGSGVPEVIEAAALHGGYIRKRVALAKLFGAAITIGSGGSAGREGPIVQIGSSIGSTLGQFLNLPGRRIRTFTACGAAAGIAATFNAPIAGALFAVEVILGDFAVSKFSPIVISAVAGVVVSRYFLGSFPAFRVPTYEFISAYEILPYSILGILAGLVSAFFIKSLSFSQDLMAKISIPDFFKPAIGGLVVGIVALFLPQVYGVGYEVTNDALWGENINFLMIILIFFKIIATAATIGSGGSGGVFAPSLVIGASLGAWIGVFFDDLLSIQIAAAGAYALVGMGAVVSGVTHAPLSSMFIIFEMTNNYRVLPPLMLSCVLSILVSSWLSKESAGTLKLAKKGINIFREKDVNLLKKLAVKNVYQQNVATVKSDATLEEIMEVVDKHPTSEVFVVNEKEEMLGIVSFIKIRDTILKGKAELQKQKALDFVNSDIPPLYLEDNLDLVIQQFGKINEDELPVVESEENKQLIGSVRLRDVIEAYNRELQRWDLTGGTHSILTASTKQRSLEITEDIAISELELPDRFVGKSISELNVRETYNLQILFIHKEQKKQDHLLIPESHYVFHRGDKILVMGNEKDIKKLGG